MSDEHEIHSLDREEHVERSSKASMSEEFRLFATSLQVWQEGHDLQKLGNRIMDNIPLGHC